jgi:tetratricopeptide (TPR) repeat protein
MSAALRTTSSTLAVLAAITLTAAIATVHKMDQLRPAATLEEVLYLPSAKILKTISLGYNGLLADIYWTRAVQYFGRKHVMLSRRYDLLPPLLDITAKLDPHLLVVYEFGSVFLAQKPPEGAGLPDKAVELVEYGISQNPNEWRLYYDLGFIHYMERKDYVAASKAFERGSQVPGAHPWLRVLAARMAEHGGELETARFLWTKTYETNQDPHIRRNALLHLRALKADDEVNRLETMARNYRERTGRYPESFAELERIGWLPGIPIDPVGHPYKLVPGGRVELAAPDDLPFATEGLPPGMKPSTLPKPESKW